MKSILKGNYKEKDDYQIWPLLIEIYKEKIYQLSQINNNKSDVVFRNCELGFSTLNFIRNDYHSTW